MLEVRQEDHSGAGSHPARKGDAEVTEEEVAVVEAMEKYGGSFVKALAECFRCADPVNFQRLRATFPDYWSQYVLMVKRIAK